MGRGQGDPRGQWWVVLSAPPALARSALGSVPGVKELWMHHPRAVLVPGAVLTSAHPSGLRALCGARARPGFSLSPCSCLYAWFPGRALKMTCTQVLKKA